MNLQSSKGVNVIDETDHGHWLGLRSGVCVCVHGTDVHQGGRDCGRVWSCAVANGGKRGRKGGTTAARGKRGRKGETTACRITQFVLYLTAACRKYVYSLSRESLERVQDIALPAGAR